MAKFIGETISEGVANQIEARENVIGRKSQYVDSYLQYKATNNAWVRLISGVDVKKLEGSESYSNTDAKNFVLSGGSLKWTGEKFEKNDAFNTNDLETNIGRYNYNSEYGIRPESGLTAFSIAHKNRFGTIREANIGFTVWNRTDLIKAEKLYFRPGFTVVVEWGNAGYIDDEARTVKDTSSIDNPDLFFSGAGNLIEIQKKIDENIAKNKFNYDAFLGFISNFSWSLRADGGYDCTIKVLTRGAIIESLDLVTGLNPATNKFFSQIPERFFSKPFEEASPDDNSSEEDRGFLRSAVDSVLGTIDEMAKEVGLGFLPSDTDLEATQRLSLLHFFCLKVEEINIEQLEDAIINYSNFENEVFNESKGNLQQVEIGRIVNKKELNPIVDFLIKEGLSEKDFKVFGFNGKTATEGKTAFRYISLKTFLALVNISFLNGKNNPNLPYFSIEERDYGNYATFLNHFSLDPSLTILPKYPVQRELRVANKRALKKLFKGTDEDENIPIKSDSYVQVLQGNVSENIISNSIVKERITNIFISTKLIKKALDQVFTSDNLESTNLLTFIKFILQEINRTLGNINELDIHYQDSPGGFYTIVDRKEINRNLVSNEVTKLNVTGVHNTVSNISLETKISNELSSMISISGTSGTSGNTSQNAGLVAYNEGVKDRFKINETSEDTDTDENTNEVDNEKAIADANEKRKSFFLSVYNAYAKFNNTKLLDIRFQGVLNERLFDKFKTEAYSRTKKAYAGHLEKEKIKPQDILPFEISIKLDGIAGLKIGQVFKLGDRLNILPENYTEDTAIIITGLDSTIENGKWYTEVKGQTFMLPSTRAAFRELTEEEKDRIGKY